MEKFTTLEQAMAYIDCAIHYFDCILSLNTDVRIKQEIMRNEYIWTCDKIASLDYKKVSEQEFEQIADAYEEFRNYYHECCE